MTALPPPSPVASPTQEQLAASLKNSSTDVALAKLLSLPGNDRCAECDTPGKKTEYHDLECANHVDRATLGVVEPGRVHLHEVFGRAP